MARPPRRQDGLLGALPPAPQKPRGAAVRATAARQPSAVPLRGPPSGHPLNAAARPPRYARRGPGRTHAPRASRRPRLPPGRRSQAAARHRLLRSTSDRFSVCRTFILFVYRTFILFVCRIFVLFVCRIFVFFFTAYSFRLFPAHFSCLFAAQSL